MTIGASGELGSAGAAAADGALVIAHELAHFQDLGTPSSLSAGGEDTRNNAPQLARATLFRERELRADTAAARVTSAKTMATTLLKVRAFASTWHEMLQQMREALSSEERPVNLSEYWDRRVSHTNSATVFDGIDSQRPNHPADTHPSLSARLTALSVSVRELAAEVLRTAPSPAAIDLIANHEALEQALSEVEYLRLADFTAKTTPSDDSL